MKTQLATLLLSLTLFGSCREDPEAIGPCGVKNPIEELSWLKEEIELYSRPPFGGYAYFTIVYKGERVFWLYSPSSSSFSQYRTCEGKYKEISSSPPKDAETKRFIELLSKPATACPYLIWSSTIFKQYGTCP